MQVSRLIALAFLFALAIPANSQDFKLENGVYILNDSNYKKFMDENPNVFLELYAPWCGHCQALEPEYNKLGTKIHASDLPVKIAKIDAEANSEASEEFKVAGYPTIKFIMGGQNFDYKGKRSAASIEEYLKKKLDSESCEKIASENQAQTLAKKTDSVLAVYNSKKKENFNKFATAFMLFEGLECYHSTDSNVLKHFSLDDNTVMMVQVEGIQKKYSGDHSMEDYRTFVQVNKNPIVMEVTNENAEEIVGDGNNGEFLTVISHKETLDAKTREELRTAGQDPALNGLQILYTVKGSEIFEQMTATLGVTPEEKELILVLKMRNEEMMKYFFEGEITSSNLVQFVKDYKAGKIERHLNSEEVPEKQDGAVEAWVGKNFQENLKNTDNDVYVFFYAPWCGYCESLLPVFEGLAKKIQDVGMKIKLVKVDATKNDVAGFVVAGFPTLYFIPANNKTAQFSYEDETRTEVTLAGFARKHATVPWKEIELDMAAHKKMLKDMQEQENDGPVPKELQGEEIDEEGDPEEANEEEFYDGKVPNHDEAPKAEKKGEL